MMESGQVAADHTLCPVARAQAIVGDRFTVIILRELFMGNRRFEQLQCQADVTPQMLATRLKKLETLGLLERRAYSTRPLRYEYVLTPMGLAFHPVLLALRAWGRPGSNQARRRSRFATCIIRAVRILAWGRPVRTAEM